MYILKTINNLIAICFAVCYVYQLFYVPVAWLGAKKRRVQTIKNHSYAVLICARNEAAVIGDLIDSIRAQTYDRKLIHVFVMADNCTDDTAAIARKKGAIVYTRQNRKHIGKGYALQELRRRVNKEYPAGFDGYFVLDADNLLARNYIEEMNKSFCEGHEIITSYRNSKNYGDNWISAGYGLWFLRESKYLNQARSRLGVSCTVSGTGFLFSRKIAEEMGDWNYHTLTEDVEFSADQIVKGRKIAFCGTAELYDEQPTRFVQSWRQRMRWSKGYLQVFRAHGKELIRGIFHGNFSCFDMAMTIMPAFILSCLSVVCNLALAIWGAAVHDDFMVMVDSTGHLLANVYMTFLAAGAVTLLTEWRHIKTGSVRKLLLLFTFPLFMFTYMPISILSIFSKVEWKPIIHTVSAHDFKKELEKAA